MLSPVYLKIFTRMPYIFNIILINYFPQLSASLDLFPQPDWLHVLCATDDLFSHVMKVLCAFHAQEQQ